MPRPRSNCFSSIRTRFREDEIEVLLKKRDPAYNEIIDSINGIITEKGGMRGQHGDRAGQVFHHYDRAGRNGKATAYFQTVQATIISLFAELGSTLIPLREWNASGSCIPSSYGKMRRNSAGHGMTPSL